MTHSAKSKSAAIALTFVRPVLGLSEEVQRRMLKKAVEGLGLRSELYRSELGRDANDERSSLLNDCRGNEVVVVARLNVFGRGRKELNGSVSRDFLWFVGELKSRCGWILVLDDNLSTSPPNTSVSSEDEAWKAVVERATDVASNGRRLSSEEAREKASLRWTGSFRGVVSEWRDNPERAQELQECGRIWRDPIYANAQEAYEAMPDEVKAQIKSLSTANKIFGRRCPGAKVGRPKKALNVKES